MPFVNRTRAIFRMAEFGFLGVFVVTLMQTPLLNGDGKKRGRFFIVLKLRVRAMDFDFRVKLERFFRISWLIVGILSIVCLIFLFNLPPES